MEIVLGDKTYDLEKALPITLGDIKKLKAVHGVRLADLSSMDADIVSKVLLLMCQKVNTDITENMVDAIPLVLLGEIAEFLSRAVVPDRPISG